MEGKYYPEFRGALKVAKDVADEKIEKALYQRAKGYSYRAEKVVVESRGNNEGSEARVVEYTEHMPPDTTAAIFFLKNRRPDRWRDVQRIDAAMGHYVLSETPMTEEEWIRERTIADGSKVIELKADDAYYPLANSDEKKKDD